MRDGAAETGRGGSFRVDVNELPILRGIRERVDPSLVDLQPAGRADFLADLGPDLVEAGHRHQKGKAAGGCSEARASTRSLAAKSSISERRIADRFSASVS